MPLISRSRPEVHWSKDYIEHLRAVHFALVLAAITALLFSVSPSKTKLERAQNQIHTIQVFLEKQAENLKKFEDARQKVAVPLRAIWVGVELSEHEKMFAVQPSEYDVIGPFGVESPLPENGVSVEEWTRECAATRYLYEFRDLWDTTRAAQTIHYSVLQIVGMEKTINQAQPIELGVENREKVISRGFEYTGMRFVTSFSKKETTHTFFNDAKLPRLIDALPSPRFQIAVFELMGTGLNLYARAEKNYGDEVRIFQVVMPQWTCRADFETCFPELARLTINKDAYTLKDLSDNLDHQLTSNEHQVELVGLKIPTESLSVGGIVLIVVVLVYFCIHLWELAPKVGASDSGLEVAWLGLYSSWLAFGLVWVSVLLLPCLAVAMLGLKGADYDGGFAWSALKPNLKLLSLWAVIPTIATGTLGALSCLASRRLALLAANAFNKDATVTVSVAPPVAETISGPKSRSDGVGTE